MIASITTKINPSIYLTRDGYTEEMWRNVHSIQHKDYKTPDVFSTVYVASQHRQPKRISYG